jgi:hypothetical protein
LNKNLKIIVSIFLGSVGVIGTVFVIHGIQQIQEETVILSTCIHTYPDMNFTSERDCKEFEYYQGIRDYFERMEIACKEDYQGLGYNSAEECHMWKIDMIDPAPFELTLDD